MLLKPRLALASAPGPHGRLSNTQKAPEVRTHPPTLRFIRRPPHSPNTSSQNNHLRCSCPPSRPSLLYIPGSSTLTASFLSPLACPPPPSPADTQVEKPQISAGQPEPWTAVLFPSTLLIRVRAVWRPSVSHSLRFSCRKSIFSLSSSFPRLTRISIRVSLSLHPLCRPLPLPSALLLLLPIIVHKKMLLCHSRCFCPVFVRLHNKFVFGFGSKSNPGTKFSTSSLKQTHSHRI